MTIKCGHSTFFCSLSGCESLLDFFLPLIIPAVGALSLERKVFSLRKQYVSHAQKRLRFSLARSLVNHLPC